MKYSKHIFLVTVFYSLIGFAELSSAKAEPKAFVHGCAEIDSIGFLIGNLKTYANGAIRVAHISTEEPASTAEHILIFADAEPQGAGCYAISATADGVGFGSIEFNDMKSIFDPKNGLLLSVPINLTDKETGGLIPNGILYLRLIHKNNTYFVTVVDSDEDSSAL